MAGGIGGFLIQRLSGILNTSYPKNAYEIMFAISALAYIVAWTIIRLLTLKPSKIAV
jgi:ACS family hexuronate transporter-like MFS transporter